MNLRKSLITTKNEVCYLCRESENHIGFLHLSSRNDYVEGVENLPVAYVEAIYVKPNYRKQGIAKKMMSFAENWAKQRGYKQLASDTELTNSASIDFHKKIGFAEAGRIVCFIKDLSH